MEGTGHLCRVRRVAANASRSGIGRRSGLPAGQRRGLERATPRPAATASGGPLPGAVLAIADGGFWIAVRGDASGLAYYADLPVYPVGRLDCWSATARRAFRRAISGFHQPHSRALGVGRRRLRRVQSGLRAIAADRFFKLASEWDRLLFLCCTGALSVCGLELQPPAGRRPTPGILVG